MSLSVYDEVDVDDMSFDAAVGTFYFPCVCQLFPTHQKNYKNFHYQPLCVCLFYVPYQPCGDKFFITLDDLLSGEDIARCPSCSLLLRVIAADLEDLEKRFS